MRVWIGSCRLRATSAERRQWIGDHEQARGSLLFPATSREDYERGLRAALLPLGYDLLSVSRAGPVEDAHDLISDRRDLAALIAHVSRTKPLPLGGFEPIDAVTAWRETDWDDLFTEGTPLWAVIDGVSWPEAQKVLRRTDADHSCLYSTLNPESRSLAPWLVQVEPGSQFAQLLRAHPQADHAYILFRSGQDMAALRRHLRRFTMLHTPADSQSPVYFRFYDPRVLIDAIEAMRPSFIARFTEDISELIAPLSPLCLNPSAVEYRDQPISPFTEEASCQGRLLRWQVPQSDGLRSGDLKVTESEFAIFTERMQLRATHKLARNLHAQYGDLADADRCLSVASRAQAAAAEYDLSTVKQVTAFARAMLAFGDDFATRDRDASLMLNDQTLLPWQKKNQLDEWFVKAQRRRMLASFERGELV